MPTGALRQALFGGKAAAAASPILAAGPMFWLREGTSPVWQDSARTTPAVADTDPEGAKDDLSGNGNHALQATANMRPLYRTNVQNGRPAARHDGSNDYQKITSNAGLNPQKITLFAALKITSLANTPIFIGKNLCYNLYALPTGELEADYPNALGSPAGTVVVGNSYILMLVVDGANMFIYKNGVQVATRASAANLASNSNDVGIGALGNGIEPASCDYYEAGGIGRAVTAGERANIFAEINSVWNIY